MDDDLLFVMEDTREQVFFHLLTLAQLRQEGRKTAIWSLPMRVREEAMNGVVWLGRHRSLWSRWRGIVERGGAEAMTGEITSLFRHTLVEDVESILMRHALEELDVHFSVNLVTQAVELATFRFGSVDDREDFIDWYKSPKNAHIGPAFVKVACLNGPEVLENYVRTMFLGGSEFERARERAVAMN